MWIDLPVSREAGDALQSAGIYNSGVFTVYPVLETTCMLSSQPGTPSAIPGRVGIGRARGSAQSVHRSTLFITGCWGSLAERLVRRFCASHLPG